MDKKARIEFIVCHTAKNVIYNATNFVEKNKDELSLILTQSILSSKRDQIVKIFKGVTGDSCG